MFPDTIDIHLCVQAAVGKRSGVRDADLRKSQKRKREDSGPDTQEACAQTNAVTRKAEAQRPTQEGRHATQTRKPYQYVCPFCKACVSSTVRTGQVNHRRVCGNFFAVREGKVAMKGYAYCCPWCKATVSSNVKTERVDHRTVCGNKFRVKDGVVNRPGCRHAAAQVMATKRPAADCPNRAGGWRAHCLTSLAEP